MCKLHIIIVGKLDSISLSEQIENYLCGENELCVNKADCVSFMEQWRTTVSHLVGKLCTIVVGKDLCCRLLFLGVNNRRQ